MARKTKEESQFTRDRILDAAEETFLSVGVTAATVAQIADRAGVSRGAVYGHYKNKVDICLAMCRRSVRRLGPLPQRVQGEPRVDVLLRLALHLMKQWVQPGSMQKTMIVLYYQCEEKEELAPLLRFRKWWERMYSRRIRRQLRLCIKAGELPATLDETMAINFINCSLTGIYHCITGDRRWLQGGWDGVANMLYIVLDTLRYSPYMNGRGR